MALSLFMSHLFVSLNSLPLDRQHICAGALIVIALWVVSGQFKSSASSPPGPWPIPLIGNVFDFDPTQPFRAFTKWKYEYGDVVSVKVLGNNILVLNSLKAINDILDKRGANYSHRPQFTVVGELMGLNQSMASMPYTPQWRACRKLSHQALSPSAVTKYHTLQEDIAALLAKEMIDRPADFYDSTRVAAARVVLAVTYGIPIKTADSEYITDADATMRMISEAFVPGAFLADLIPVLKYLPRWMPFHRHAARGKVMIENLVTMPFERVKSEMTTENARPSLAHDLLSNTELREDESRTKYEHNVKWTTGSMYGAGGETTYSTTLNFIMAMALHPEIQARAQKELDEVVGTDRMPLIADRDRLPFVNAVIKETMRWKPVLPLSLPRRSDKDDVYESYIIPKDTIVVPNIWAIAFEPNGKYDPEKFLPGRFLDPTCSVADPSSWVFGFGRRICPGKHLGENSVFIIIATLLSTFTFKPDPQAPLTPTYDTHLIRYPKPFKCIIVPRSAEKVEIISRRTAQSEA